MYQILMVYVTISMISNALLAILLITSKYPKDREFGKFNIFLSWVALLILLLAKL